MKRSKAEWVFIMLFVPSIVLFYAVYKYPQWFLGENADTRILGKNLSFWYNLIYTSIICSIAGKVLLQGKNVFSFRANITTPLSSYQRKKFTSIFLVQLFVFFLLPFVILPLIRGVDFWDDTLKIASKNAHVYLYPGFQSAGMALYLFLFIPLIVWLFGKRYCSWFCACGNLAETVGVTKWGKKWVSEGTPRGEKANKSHLLQTIVMLVAFGFGFLLLLDAWNLLVIPELVGKIQAAQDFSVDFMFGSVVGVGAYPFFGTRIWCRYGCPLAKFMELSGKATRSRFAVVANEKCKGINLCTKACPMGIDVASYAHKDKKPILGSFGLDKTPCIGCGGCIDVCPANALSFKKINFYEVARAA